MQSSGPKVGDWVAFRFPLMQGLPDLGIVRFLTSDLDLIGISLSEGREIVVLSKWILEPSLGLLLKHPNKPWYHPPRTNDL